MTVARKERIDACTIYIEGPAVQAPEEVARMLAKYGVKDIRICKNNGEYAFVELESPEQVELAIKELSSESLTILNKAKYQDKKQEMKNIESELRDVLMMQQTQDMMKDTDEASLQDFFVKLILQKDQD